MKTSRDKVTRGKHMLYVLHSLSDSKLFYKKTVYKNLFLL